VVKQGAEKGIRNVGMIFMKGAGTEAAIGFPEGSENQADHCGF